MTRAKNAERLSEAVSVNHAATSSVTLTVILLMTYPPCTRGPAPTPIHGGSICQYMTTTSPTQASDEAIETTQDLRFVGGEPLRGFPARLCSQWAHPHQPATLYLRSQPGNAGDSTILEDPAHRPERQGISCSLAPSKPPIDLSTQRGDGPLTIGARTRFPHSVQLPS
jgi:hypothetical protein